jgi:hypothetical protein
MTMHIYPFVMKEYTMVCRSNRFICLIWISFVAHPHVGISKCNATKFQRKSEENLIYLFRIHHEYLSMVSRNNFSMRHCACYLDHSSMNPGNGRRFRRFRSHVSQSQKRINFSYETLFPLNHPIWL